MKNILNAQFNKMIKNKVDCAFKQKIIFVIGCDRSGTHWISYILKDHSQIYGTIEDPIVFSMVTKLALNTQKKDELYPKVVDFYQQQLKQNTSKHYMDKSHPNIWQAEALAKTFPNALFVGILRNPLETISSMKKHYVPTSWHDNWKKYPVPNMLLGINNENAVYYEQLSSIEKYIVQLKAHYWQMTKLERILGSKLFVIDYDNLVINNVSVLHKLTKFLGLSSPLVCKEIRNESLWKWKKNLTQKEIDIVLERF